MVEKVYKLSVQPVKPLIDVSFWTAFSKLKLDIWKLETPVVKLEAKISLPASLNAV